MHLSSATLRLAFCRYWLLIAGYLGSAASLFFNLRIKRLCDLCLALVALVMLSPLLLFSAVLILVLLGPPVFFVQQRPGLNGKPFRLCKFRTMSSKRDANGILLPDAMRMTSFGRFLRSTSIDELPALINIILGEMSFVGPRPLLTEYMTLYSCDQARRHDVMPGFTGWAQIHGRNTISWDEKFRLDVWYVDNQSFWLDLRIFVVTILKVLRREGISSVDHVTMKPFEGSSAPSSSIESLSP